MRHRGVAAVLALLVVTTGCTGDDDGAAPTTLPGDRVETGEGDPDAVALVGFDDEPISFADYEGRPLVVNFFASWCAPCVREMPDIEAVKQSVGDDVAFLGIAQRDRVEDARELIEETGITWDVARDPQGDAAVALGVVRMPTTFLVSADGEILAQHGGAISQDELRELLEEHFGVGA